MTKEQEQLTLLTIQQPLFGHSTIARAEASNSASIQYVQWGAGTAGAAAYEVAWRGNTLLRSCLPCMHDT